MKLTLAGVFEWFAAQIKYILFFGMLILLIVSAFRRAWITLFASLIGVAFIGIFVITPDIILTISEWLSGLLNMG